MYGAEQGVTIYANLHPGGQGIELTLTAHGAALPHRQFLVAACDATGAHVRISTQAPRPRAVPACGHGPLRPRRCPRRCLMPRRGCFRISFEHGRGMCPIALRLARSAEHTSE